MVVVVDMLRDSLSDIGNEDRPEVERPDFIDEFDNHAILTAVMNVAVEPALFMNACCLMKQLTTLAAPAHVTVVVPGFINIECANKVT